MQPAGNRKSNPLRVSVTQEVSMECPGCHSFMGKERLYDVLENDGQDLRLGHRAESTDCG